MDWLAATALGNALITAVIALPLLLGRWWCRNPAFRHALWVLVILKLLTPPFFRIPVGLAGFELPGTVTTSVPVEYAGGPVGTQRPGSLELVPRHTVPASPPSLPASAHPEALAVPWPRVLLAVWLLGCAVLWATAAARTLRFGRLLHGAKLACERTRAEVRHLCAHLGIRHPPEVRLVDAVMPPVLWAVGKRRVVALPERLWGRLDGEEREALLVHELAHLRRGDHWIRWVELAVAGVYWWYPLVWWVQKELRQAEEEACDAWVVWALPGRSGAYRAALLRTAAFVSGIRPWRSFPGRSMGHLRNLRRRLVVIENRISKGGRRPRIDGLAWFALACAAAGTLPFFPVLGRHGDAGRASNDSVPEGRDGAKQGQDKGRKEDELKAAIRAALDWLCRHQSPDGGWKARDFTKQCRTPCRNRDPRYGDGCGIPAHDVGVTGLAMLALAGYGHSHREGRYPEYSRRLSAAVRYLLGVQIRSDEVRENGLFGLASGDQWIYGHAIATWALAELLVMSRDRSLESTAARAVRLCLEAQNDGWGWRYGIQPGDNDTSVTGWMVMALKAAKLSGLGISDERFERAFAGASRWIDRVTDRHGKTGYRVPGDDGSVLLGVYPDPYPYAKDLPCMTAVGVLVRLFAGRSRSDPLTQAGVKLLLQHLPAWKEAAGRAPSTISFYYWYWGAYALSQYGGAEWERWRAALLEVLLGSQRLDAAEEDGSWDPIGESGAAGGRVYSTALGAMALEILYRRAKG